MGDAIRPVADSRAAFERHDRVGLLVRRAGVAILAGVVIAALFNVFGQRANTAVANGAAASVEVHAPTVVRPGLLYQAKISITARSAIPAAQLVFSHGWFDGMTLNTAEPGPATETSARNGSVIFSIGPLTAGQTFVQYLEFQVNPTSSSRRGQVVTVRSHGVGLVSLSRTMTVFP
ncbi:MAG: hypothetical protein JO246_13650 [Frankiaceae bacterium]|nr:hypothetical protein [Frankiaceae bacterium]MBV9871150.1 hypothetical protein [Frankiaceae bacterium]